MSGYLIQGRHGTKGNFEVVVPSLHGEGLVHLWRNNDPANLPWAGPTCFGRGAVTATGLIQSNYGPVGNLEVVANEGGRLAFYWRIDRSPWTWSGPFYLTDGIRGNPALIQSGFGTKGNFELVAAHRDGGLFHMWRNNDVPSMPWSAPVRFGRGAIDGVALIQGNYGRNLELVVNEGGRLAFYWRMDRAPWTWSGPFYVADGVRGTPALIQSRFGTRGNFELIAPHRDGGLIHLWRNNDVPSMPWSAPARFGSGTVDEVSVIQGNFGGNLEIVTREAGRTRFYWRIDRAPWTFHGPFPIGVDRAWNWTECVYSGRAGYHQADTDIVVRIQLNPDTGVTDATMNTLRTTWRDGIIAKWSDRFDCRPPAGQGRRITFDVQWVGSGAHHTVRVRPGPARSNQLEWDTSDTGDVASHEFGHMLGLPDEYSDAACPARSPVNTGSVMDDNTEAVARHLGGIASFHCGHTPVAAAAGEPAPGEPAGEPDPSERRRMKQFDEATETEQQAFVGHLRDVAAGRGEGRSRAAKVQLVVSGGPPTERYEYVLELLGDGTARTSERDELRGIEARRGEAVLDPETVRRAFARVTERPFLDTAEHPAPIPPDALVATLVVTEGDIAKRVSVPVVEEADIERAGRERHAPMPVRRDLYLRRDDTPRPVVEILDDLEAVANAVEF